MMWVLLGRGAVPRRVDELGGPYEGGLPFPFPALPDGEGRFGEGLREDALAAMTPAVPSPRRADRRPHEPVGGARAARWRCSRCSSRSCRSPSSSGPTAADHGSPLAGWAGSWLIYGGSAHLAAIRTLDGAGAVDGDPDRAAGQRPPPRLQRLAGRRWRGQPRWFRFVGAGLIIDPTWAAAERHAEPCADPAPAAPLLHRRRPHARHRMVGRDRRRSTARRPSRLARPRDRRPAVPARPGRAGAAARRCAVGDRRGRRDRALLTVGLARGHRPARPRSPAAAPRAGERAGGPS